MSEAASFSLGKLIQLSTPVLTIFVLCILSVMPVPLSLEFLTAAPLPLAGLFFWSVHRPEILPMSVCFLLGLFTDVVGGGPLGLWAVIFMLVHRFVNTERQILAGRLFAVVWFGFSIVATISASAIWLANMLYHFQILSPLPALVQAGLGIAIYPLVAWPLALIHLKMR